MLLLLSNLITLKELSLNIKYIKIEVGTDTAIFRIGDPTLDINDLSCDSKCHCTITASFPPVNRKLELGTKAIVFI